MAVYCRRGRLLELHRAESDIDLTHKRYKSIGRLPTAYVSVSEYGVKLEELREELQG